jgi:hypothetical protein
MNQPKQLCPVCGTEIAYSSRYLKCDCLINNVLYVAEEAHFGSIVI